MRRLTEVRHAHCGLRLQTQWTTFLSVVHIGILSDNVGQHSLLSLRQTEIPSSGGRTEVMGQVIAGVAVYLLACGNLCRYGFGVPEFKRLKKKEKFLP